MLHAVIQQNILITQLSTVLVFLPVPPAQPKLYYLQTRRRVLHAASCHIIQ
jgi:hypothetical protein